MFALTSPHNNSRRHPLVELRIFGPGVQRIRPENLSEQKTLTLKIEELIPQKKSTPLLLMPEAF